MTGDNLESAAEKEIGQISWRDTPLHQGLDRLGRSQNVRIWLDRRIDPGQTVTATVAGQPLLEAVRELAQAVGADACLAEPVIYVGPPETTAVLATVGEFQWQAAGEAAAAVSQALRETTTLQWPQLASPAELLGDVAEQCGLTWSTPPAPHDLWAAGELPPTARCRQLTLLLAGFGRTYQVQGNRLETAPLPRVATLQVGYALPRNKAAAVEQLQGQLSRSRLIVRGGKLWVDGPLEEHRQVRRWLAPGKPRPSGVSRPRSAPRNTYDLRAVETAGRLIREIARRLEFDLELDPRCGARLEQRVELDTQGASRDELIQAILEPAGLGFRWRDGTLVVAPK